MTRFNLTRPRVLAVVGALALGGVLGGCGSDDGGGSAGAGEKTELKFSYMAGEATPIGELWTWWMDEIEKRSDSTITFDRYWDATLLKATETIEGVKDGRADVAQVLPTVYAGKFPVSSAGELPFESSNAPAVAETLRELGSEEGGPLRKEWTQQGLVPMAWSIGASSAFASNKPIKAAGDLKGMRIRANDRGSKVLKSVGANLINIELAEIYGSMDRGLIDGIYGIPFSFIGPLKYPEIAKHFTDLGTGVATVNALTMSESKWKSLSEEQQKIVNEVSAEAPAKLAEIEGAADQASCKVVKDAGDSVSVLPAAEVEKIKAGGKDGVVAAWKKEVSAKGVDAEDYYATYTEKLKAAEGKFPDFKSGIAACVEAGA